MKRSQKRIAILLAATAILWGGALSGVYAGDAVKDKDIIFNGAVKEATYDISGSNKDTNIAVGRGAKFFIGGGTQESLISFGEKVDITMDPYFGLAQTGWNVHSNQAAKENLPAAIAIGQNTYARTGSIQVGSHTLEKNNVAIGDTTAKVLRQFGNASTTLGTNSYTGGGFATNIGSFNVHSSQYEAGGWSDYGNATKNSFATIVGTFNSNESINGNSTSGIANVINGAANKVTNSNGSIVIGAGNTVKNSSDSIYHPDSLALFDSVADMQNSLIEGVRKNSGGAALVMGGGNQVDSTTYSQLLGVNNNSTNDTYVLLDGFKNTSSNSNNLSVMGSENTANESEYTQLFGDKRKLTNVQKSVILGSAEQETELAVSNATILGYNANVKAEGGVALGSGSIASTAAGAAGYDPSTKAASTETGKEWKATWSAVSVGDGNNTRQITGVAAGTADTDAVNVAQLKKALENAGGGTGGTGGTAIVIEAGEGIRVEQSGSKYTIHSTVSGGSGGGGPLNFAADEGTAATVNTNETLTISGDNKNISTEINGKRLSVKLKDDISVNSVTINNGPTINNNGIDMNNTKITNLADGDVSEGSHDAVTGGQLWNVEQSMNGRMSRLDTKINRVGAGAAAMANLHPLDFDPEDKWSFSAGFGNYRSASAMAVGAFYRPNERTLFSVSGSFGNGENMIGAGVSFKLGKEAPKTRANLEKTIANLENTVRNQEEAMKVQDEKIARLEALVEKLMENK